MTVRFGSQPLRVVLTKIGTLVFSGGVASLAILQAGSSGCDPAPPPTAEEPKPEAQQAEEPSARPTPEDTKPETVVEPKLRRAPVEDAGNDEPPRYLGGSKSDVDVWGIGGVGIGSIEDTPTAEAGAKEPKAAKGSQDEDQP